MTSRAVQKNRATGTFVPDPNIVGRLLGKGCRSLHDLAKNVGDGVYIRYDFDAYRFDIAARTPQGVQKAIHALMARQAQALNPNTTAVFDQLSQIRDFQIQSRNDILARIDALSARLDSLHNISSNSFCPPGLEKIFRLPPNNSWHTFN